VASGTEVLDWTIPLEWNIRDAWVESESGERVVDFARSNLHVMGYSVPVSETMGLEQLRRHLHSIPDHRDWIPYKTSYYHPDWGFCLAHRDLEALADGNYRVEIDSSLEEGSLTFGELLVEGDCEDEVLVSCHICHPSMCNDNLSGVAVAAFLADHLRQRSLRLSYRFLFIPGTIGAITWLALNEEHVGRVKHGLVLAGVGDEGALTYKESRSGTALIDRAAAHVLSHWEDPGEIRRFEPYGYDERQFCSPGFDLPVGCLMRTPWGEYPQYHTSADDLSFVTARSLEDTYHACLSLFDVLEGDRFFENLNPKGEPQLGRRGVYSKEGGHRLVPDVERALLWVLNYSDGRNSLLDIAQRSGFPFSVVAEAVEILEGKGLIAERTEPDKS
jgi:aminopeptidase-like protein